jgi:hypothetical protein
MQAVKSRLFDGAIGEISIMVKLRDNGYEEKVIR